MNWARPWPDPDQELDNINSFKLHWINCLVQKKDRVAQCRTGSLSNICQAAEDWGQEILSTQNVTSYHWAGQQGSWQTGSGDDDNEINYIEIHMIVVFQEFYQDMERLLYKLSSPTHNNLKVSNTCKALELGFNLGGFLCEGGW